MARSTTPGHLKGKRRTPNGAPLHTRISKPAKRRILAARARKEAIEERHVTEGEIVAELALAHLNEDGSPMVPERHHPQIARTPLRAAAS